MDIVVKGSAPANMDSSKDGKGTYVRREMKKERRKNRRDRRESVREGIFVYLSVKNDRRRLRNRRKAGL
ncbi:MAG: hypothetical protein JRJ43_00350 [Deltaproteobacteria bacterium]|nr:hypothetical protein [Deltaproteobacteria bacterium]MBW1718001.1 hypothetical protein [Deltaproteobacteria bacterium]MBW1931784.1 hypothetical protein [Deltaproteobacteria bacterium]MBW1937906.1 hypothetical protein [Deltaproteobacteria bacterium]MBW1963747.1 hypothetical protein [Deltaproteobacteria bacterium]